MMLTQTQSPAPYGYKSVHDLPTPPSTFRPSPPPTHPEAPHRPSASGHSPASLLMSTPHRSLPPPAAMALPPQQPPPSAVVTPASHHGQPPGPLAHGQAWTGLPPPPQQWQGAEESMRNWLAAKAEEEKTRQEEERTRQEGLRLEQRRVEMDMLRASLSGGIPPPMIPLVFAGMGAGGTLPQAALEWAQHFMQSAQAQHAQLPPPQRPHSPEHHHRRGPSPAQGPFAGPAANLAPTQGPGAYGHYPASPTRPRGQTVTGALGRHAPSVPGLGANPAQPSPMAPYQQQQQQQQSHVQATSVQQDATSSIYFHHWQPPASQGGSGGPNRPGTPSGDTHRKRKTAASQQQHQQHQQHHHHHQQQQQQQQHHHLMQAAGEQRLRSPPSFVQSSQSNPPAGRRTHKRQRSDVTWYRPPGQGQADEAERAGRTRTPSREGDTGSPREAYGAEGKMHPVSALLSREPAEAPRSHYYLGYSPQAPVAERRDEEGVAARDRGHSPGRGEAKPGGGAAGSGESFR